MPHIPVDQLKDILPNLSHKDLVRFSSVSEQWKDTITDPNLAKTHLQHSITTKSSSDSSPLIFLFPSAVTATFYFSLEFFNNDDTRGQLTKINQTKSHQLLSSIDIVGQCNGLVLYSRTAPKYDESGLVLWNPSIRKFKRIPLPPANIRLSFNYFRKYDGIGYDSVHDDYKIVRISPTSDGGWRVHAYSLKSNAWKRITANLPDNDYDFNIQRNAVFFNGALHWLATHEQNRTLNIIISLDLATDTFRQLPMPHGWVDAHTMNAMYDFKAQCFAMSLVAMGGHLCIYPKKALNRAWIMKAYGVTESWTALYSFGGDDKVSNCRPIMLANCGKKVLVEENHCRLKWYDLEKNTRTLVQIDGMPSAFSTFACVGNIHLLRN